MESLTVSIRFIALLSAVIATLAYPKYAGGKARYFLFSIWLIAVTEFSYRLVYYHIIGEKYPVHFIANIYTLVQFLFYLFWYRYLIRSAKRKLLLLAFALLFVGFAIANTVLWQDFMFTQTYSYALGTVFTIIAISLYFMEVFNNDFILNFERSVYFWFSLGVLLFFIPFLPFMIASELFDYSGDTYDLVLVILNVVMHSCFIIGVLWSKKKYNY